MLIWEQEDTNVIPPNETLPPGGLTQKLLYWNPVTSKWETIGIGSGLQVVNGELVATGSAGNNLIELTWTNNGDTKGLVYHLGTNGGTQSFVNPVPSVLYGLMSSGIWISYPANTDWTVDKATNRQDTVPAHTNDVANSWIGFKLPAGKKIAINKYTAKSRHDFNGFHPVSWILEGSNNVAGNTVADFDNATWTQIHNATGQNFTNINQWKDYDCNGAFFNSLRIKSAGDNSGGTPGMAFGEFEFYGYYQS